MKEIILKLISFYRSTKFFLAGPVCKFQPTCSDYTYQAVEKYGSLKGLYLGLRRILRCHPFSSSGFDPVK